MFSSDERKPSANKAWIKCIQVVNLSSIYGPGTYSKWFWFSTSRAGPEHLPFFWKFHRLWWWHLGLSTRFSAGPNPNFLLDASQVGYRQATRGTPNMGISIIPILQIRKLRHREVKKFVQGYTACESQSRNLKSGSLTPSLWSDHWEILPSL